MIRRLRSVLAVLLLSLLAACAGTDFVRPDAAAFKLGKTSSAEVLKQLGQPRTTGEVLTNGKNVRVMTFAYAASGGEALEPDVIPARAMSYFFHDDVLVGQEFLSSFKSDHSDFDEKKVPGIQKGKTTRAEVIRTLGRPSATFLPPMVKETSGEAIGYAYQTTRGGVISGFKFYRKILRVTFDAGDRVAEVEYSTAGSR
ncbi:MAG: hypothetical protein JSS40_00050 [Proteobacteria bacterium]|nr:hypothetical protein [Pseudomonadota bacterium]